MLSTKTKQILSQFLLELSFIEQNAEQLRQALCFLPEFEPYSYFKSICSQQLMDLNSLRQFFTSQQKSIRLQGLIGVILAHDTDHDGCLDYKDFLLMILPNENISLRQGVALREKQLKKIDNSQIHDKFVNLIQFESDSYMRLQNIKNELQSSYDYSVYDCFRNIDIKEQGYIDYDSLRRFLQNSPSDGQVQNTIIRIMRRLNKNISNERITYEVFSQHIKNQINYVQQFSPEKLEEKKKHQQNANHMYSLYGQFLNQGQKSLNSSTFLRNSTLTTTPQRRTRQGIDRLHNLSLSNINLTNSFMTPKTKRSDRIHTQKTPVRTPSMFSPIRELLTPVRLTNLKSIHKKKALFNKTVDKEFLAPMRHSPFVSHQYPNKSGRTHNYHVKTSSFDEPITKPTHSLKVTDTKNSSKIGMSRVNLQKTIGLQKLRPRNIIASQKSLRS